MAIPATALVWPEPMDPSDIVDYAVDLTTLLDTNEGIASYSVILLSEAELLGLVIGTGSRSPQLIEGTKLRIWFSILQDYQQNAAFSGQGASLPIQITIDTTSSPARRKQRTLVVKVQQR